MLVTTKQLKENLTSTLTLIKAYIDSRFRAYFEQDTSNVYAEAVVVEE
jgi:hypothetical protein